jgi:hypothetical protein
MYDVSKSETSNISLKVKNHSEIKILNSILAAISLFTNFYAHSCL